MKKSLLFSILFSLILLSCKKENITDNAGDETAAVIKKLVHTTINGDISIDYNVDGTPHKITTTQSGGAKYEKVYTYSPGKVNYLLTMGGKKSEIGEYILLNGRISSFQWTYYDYFEDPINTFNETYLYNAKGLLERHNFGGNVYTLYSYDNKDNLILKLYHNEQGVLSDKVEYAYGNQKDLFPSFGYMRNYGDGFFLPAYSKYLPVSQKVTDLLTNQVTYDGTFSYELDAQGYVTKGKWHSLTPGYQDYEWINSFQ